MKYIVILGDGMADRPIKQLGNKTPLEVANKPSIEQLAKKGEVGLVSTIPKNMNPGSDTANLSVIGYDPLKYYTGRSPLEGISMGVSLKDEDVSFRTNLVTLSEEESYENKIILDHGASDITTEESEVLIKYIDEKLRDDIIKFYSGISYRHLLVWRNGSTDVKLVPPHDIRDKCIKEYLPDGDNSGKILSLMEKSYELLNNHPINIERKKKGLNKANSIWIWGEGTKPMLPSFKQKYGLDGVMISAVDLLKGIAMCGGLKVKEVVGATGNLNTNYEGKAKAAIEELKQGKNFVYIHIEAPDECSHCGELENKIKAIELIDEKVVKYVKEKMDELNEPYKIMILPDHPTPIGVRTHTSDPVPYLIYSSDKQYENDSNTYNELYAKDSNNYIDEGYKLMDYFIDLK